MDSVSDIGSSLSADVVRVPNVTESAVVSSYAVSSSCSDWEASSTSFVLLEVVFGALVLGSSVHLHGSTSAQRDLLKMKCTWRL